MKKLEVKTSWSRRRWRRSTGRTLGLKAPDTGSLRPVELVGRHSTYGIAPDAGLCLVKVDRTRPVEEIRLGELIGNDRTLGSERLVTCAEASGQSIAVEIWRLRFNSE